MSKKSMSSRMNLKSKTSQLIINAATLDLLGGWFAVIGGSSCPNQLELMLI